MSDLNTQLLINMGQQLADLQGKMGGVIAQLEAGSKRHKEFSEQFDILDRRTDIIEDKIVVVESILMPKEGPSIITRIKNLELFQGKIGAIITGGSFLLWGVGYFIWQTGAWVASHWIDIKNFFKP